MPCYSVIPTTITDLETAKKSAEELGYTVKSLGIRLLVISNAGREMRLEIVGNDKRASATGNTLLLAPLTSKYAVNKVRQFAQKKGYNVSKGVKPGEYVLTSYR